MRPATDSLPKSLLPVVDRPFVDWQLAWLAREGVDRVVLSIGYRGELIRRHVGDGRSFGLRVEYVDEGDHPRGTAGALRLALDEQRLDTTFFVLYGDSYLLIHLEAVAAEHTRSSAPVLMTVYGETSGLEKPNAVFSDGLVTRYQKGLDRPPPEMGHVDYGISVWRRDIVETMVPSGSEADLATLFSDLSGRGQLGGYEATERFYEIGSPRGLHELEQHLREKATVGAPIQPAHPTGGWSRD
jgi:NDP-sugar pyrophosphorylase family protein